MNKVFTFLIIGMSAHILCADVWQDLAKYKMGNDRNPPPVAINALIIKTPADQMAPIEDKLIAIVESKDSTPEAKWFACRMLQRVGTDKCVPTLSKLLCDDNLSHYARLKLERLPESKAAGQALLSALDKAPDKLKAGIIGSLVERGDDNLVNPIAKYAESDNAELAVVALQALGRIGGKDALKVLKKVKLCKAPNMERGKSMADGGTFFDGSSKNNVIAALKAAHSEALLIAALSVKDADTISGIFKDSKCVVQRYAALAAMTHVDQDKAARMLGAVLKANDPEMTESALSLLSEIQGDELTMVAATAVASAPDAVKPALVNILGWRGDKKALPTVQKYLNSDNQDLSKAAISATAQLGDGSTVKPLLAQAKGDIKDSVINAVVRMDAVGVDAAIIAALADRSVNVVAAEVIALRQTQAAVPALVKLAGGADGEIRQAAWGTLGEVAGAKDLNDLAKISLGKKGRKVPSYEIDAIKKICASSSDKNAAIRAVGAYYASADDSIKMFILDIAAAAGSGDGVKYAKSALDSGNAELRLQAVRALSAWNEHGHVCDLLLELAKNAHESKIKILALRGYINQSKSEGNKKKSLAMLNSAKVLVTRPEEKKMLIDSADKWREDFIIPFLYAFVNDPDVAADARRSILNKTSRLRGKKNVKKELVDTLNLIIGDPASDKGMVKKAKEELKQIKQ